MKFHIRTSLLLLCLFPIISFANCSAFHIGSVTPFPKYVFLGQGDVTGTYSVKNNSKQKLPIYLDETKLPEEIKLSDNSTCRTNTELESGASCVLSLILKNQLKAHIIHGAVREYYPFAKCDNQIPIYITASNAIKVFPSSYKFNSQDPANFTLTNQGLFNLVSIKKISLVPDPDPKHSLNDVTIDDDNCSNRGLPSGDYCNFKLKAGSEAYGTGKVNIKYAIANKEGTIDAAVTVARPNILIEPSDNKIFLDPANIASTPSKKIITITNNGQFSVVDFKTDLHLNGVKVDNKCGESISSRASCDIEISANENALPGTNDKLTISGKNIDAKEIEVYVKGGIAMTIQSAENKSLSYQSIEVTNTTNYYTDIKTLSVTPEDKKIKFCKANAGEECLYKSTCVTGQPIKPLTSCLIWFKALEKDKLARKTTIKKTVTMDLNWDPEALSNLYSLSGEDPTEVKQAFDVDYEQDLYAGGTFTKIGDKTINNIAKWDGTTWTDVGGGVSGCSETKPSHIDSCVKTLIMWKGDLYVGGGFTEAGKDNGKQTVNYIAKWNGSNWSELDGGIHHKNRPDITTVQTMTVFENDLYVGGVFEKVGKKEVVANSIAKWDGNKWSPLNMNLLEEGSLPLIYELTAVNKNIYVGGSFEKKESSISDEERIISDIAKLYKNNSGEWQASALIGKNTNIVSGGNGDIASILSIGNLLYIGGNTNLREGQSTYNKIGALEWTDDEANSDFKELKLNSEGETPACVHTWATNEKNEIYAGGSYITINGSKNVAKYSNGSWRKLGDGVGKGDAGQVFSLLNWNHSLYVGGNFTEAGGKDINTIAKWDEDKNEWSAVGAEVSDSESSAVATLLVAPSLNIHSST